MRRKREYTLLFGVQKKNYFQIDVIFNIMQVEMSCVTFVSTQYDSFIKGVKWVGSGQLALLTGRVRVERSWHDY